MATLYININNIWSQLPNDALNLAEIQVSLDGGTTQLTPDASSSYVDTAPDTGIVDDLLDGSLSSEVYWSAGSGTIHLAFTVSPSFDIDTANISLRQGVGTTDAHYMASCHIDAYVSGTSNDRSNVILHTGFLAAPSGSNSYGNWLALNGGAAWNASRLKYADNLVITPSAAKSAGQDFFTVPLPPTHPMQVAGLPNNAMEQALMVPLTLVDAAGVVKATGHAVWFDYYNGQHRDRVYIDGGLVAAAFVAGDTLCCRLNAADYLKVSRLNLEYPVRLGSQAHADIRITPDDDSVIIALAESGCTVRLPEVGSVRRSLTKCVTLQDANNAQPTVSVSADGYSTITWVGGTPPSFIVGKSKLALELVATGSYEWVGRWERLT